MRFTAGSPGSTLTVCTVQDVGLCVDCVYCTGCGTVCTVQDVGLYVDCVWTVCTVQDVGTVCGTVCTVQDVGLYVGLCVLYKIM